MLLFFFLNCSAGASNKMKSKFGKCGHAVKKCWSQTLYNTKNSALNISILTSKANLAEVPSQKLNPHCTQFGHHE
jgi:hypothetical protein